MIVVTGGAGFIGSNLAARMEARGPVAVVDRLGHDDKWKNLRNRELEELVDPGQLDDFLTRRGSEVQAILHMGAISSTTERDADLFAEQNLRLSQRIWGWCSRHQVPLIYASSAATYGDGSHGFDDDASPAALARLRPLNAYGWSKHAFDRWVAATLRRGGPTPPQWVGLKFFNVYGPNEVHKGPMASVVTRAYPSAAAGAPARLFRSHRPDYPDGGQMRDFIYVKDCVAVIEWILDDGRVCGLYNLGTGTARTWLDLMGSLYTAIGRKLEVEWVDTPAEIRDRYQYFTQAEMARLRTAGYDRPFHTIEDGVRDYVERYLSQEDAYL